jgi:ketosteroid isomerase-like protein
VASAAEIEQAITTLRGAYAAFNRGDVDAAVAAMDSQIEWVEPAEFPGGGTYHGRDGAKQYLTQSRAACAEVHSEPEQFLTAGDRLVVFVHAGATEGQRGVERGKTRRCVYGPRRKVRRNARLRRSTGGASLGGADGASR